MILVTGGAGYIGSHTVRWLLEQSPEVELVIVDNLSEGHREFIPRLPNVQFVQADIGDLRQMADVFTFYPIEQVIHFAASAYVSESMTDPSKYYQNNVVQSLNLFKLMEAHNIRQVIFSSTCATYGIPEAFPITEETPQQPINIYGQTKWMVELALQGYCLTRGWQVIALRYFNACGAHPSGEIGEWHDPEPHVIPNLLAVAAGEQAIFEILGTDYPTPDGTCIRDYVNVNDLALAHVLALELIDKTDGFLPVNLGTGVGNSILELVQHVEAVTGQKIQTEIRPRREGDPPALVAEFEKAKAVLGWQPTTSMTESLSQAWAWFQKQNEPKA